MCIRDRAFGVAAIGGKDSMSGSFMDLDVPPTLVSFAAATADADRVVTPEFKGAGHAVYLFAAPYDRVQVPNLPAIKAAWQLVEQAMDEQKVLSAWAVDYGGIAEGLFKMALGNQLGFQLAEMIDPAALFEQNYGGIIVEAAEPLSGAILLGYTTEEPVLAFTPEQRIALSVLEALWEAPLEGVFPTTCAPSGEESAVEAVSYKARPLHTFNGSIARPKAVIPVFPGTNCEYDTARAVERAGGQAEVVVIANLTASMLQDSIQRLAKALHDAQMLILPGGFSFGDEPDGSAKFIATFMRNPLLTESIHRCV